MAVQFSVPRGPDINAATVEYFRGCDLNDASTNVDLSRSPECPNMVRDEVGKVRKRTGWYATDTFPNGKINGVYILRGGAVGYGRDIWWPDGRKLIHVGQCLYIQIYKAISGRASGLGTEVPEVPPNLGGDDDVPAEILPPVGALAWQKLCSNVHNDLSWGVQFRGYFYLLDGETIRVWTGNELKDITALATVPTVVISASPQKGGGVQYQPFNLLSDSWIESFKGEADVVAYHLSAKALDSIDRVEVMGADGAWHTVSNYTENLADGVVTFETAPGAPAVLGTDNVRITVSKAREEISKILKCRFGVLYGVNGEQDRLFLSGNPEYPNVDFYSEFNDPTYFGDTSFCEVGQDEGQIVGYSTMSGMLATHRRNGRDDRNIIVRTGSLDSNGKAMFRTVNAIQGEGAVSSHAFATLDSEPLFLTDKGVYAVTAKEVTGERYGQQRSFYISPVFQGLTDYALSLCAATIWKEFYVLALNNRLYLLDGLQKTYTKDAPSSAYQYECYYWTNIPARVLWTEGETLCFGTDDGRLCRFFTDADAMTSYQDDPEWPLEPDVPGESEYNPLTGQPIDAYWDTPDMDGKGFWRNKTFRYIACRLASAVCTGVTVWAQVKGLWRQIYTDRGKARYFDWNFLDLSCFTFSSDRTPHTLGGKIKLKKVDKVRFRFRNDKLGESFGLYGIGMEYTEPGSRYKG